MKKIIITGAAASGIGEAISRKLLGEGYGIIGTYHPDDSESAAKLLEDFPGDVIKLTELDLADRQQLLDFVGSIEEESLAALINAQMYFEMENPEDFDHSIWDKSLAVNLTAPNILVRELQGRLAGGTVVTITSTEGFMGSFGASAYACTKAAIHNLTKTLANTLGPKNIRVNAVAAGWIGGVMDTDEIFNMSRKITPLGRLGAPDEIANVTSFLLSDKASFVNGSVLVADGGYSGVDTISKYEFEADQQS